MPTLKIDVIADGSKAGRELDNVGGKVGSFGRKLAVGAAAGAAGVALAAGKIALDSIKSASAVEQAYGGIDSVFGKTAASVKKNAQDAATTVGLASSEYGNLATVLGAQLKNMGTSSDQLAPKTDALIKQGADLAATFGGTTADAVSAVSSLLKGERDPIEKYGVSIKAADVAARLQAQGLDKLTGPAKTAAEAQATLALLTEQTTSAQGAFGRESDTVAGQQQRLTAQWENAKAGLGQGLLPIVTRLATFFTTKVMPAISVVASNLARTLGPAISRVGQFITGTLVPAARQFITWFQERIAPGIRSAVTPVINGLRSAFASVQAAIQRNKPQIDTIGRVLKSLAEFIATKVAPVVGKVLGEAFKTAGHLIGGAVDTIGAVVSAIQSAIDWIKRLKEAASNIGGGILSKLPGFGFMSAPTYTTTVAAAPAPSSRMATLMGGAQPLSAPATFDLGRVDLTPANAAPAVNHYWTVNVDGALDPIAVAEQITDLLKAQARRTGRAVLA